MYPHNFRLILSGMALAVILSSCSGLKKAAQTPNYDDAYFSTGDLSGNGIYARRKATAMPELPAQRVAGSSSYGQTYSDRLRNFGGSRVQQPFRPALAVTPMGMTMMPRAATWGFNPWMAPNPWMANNPWMGGNPWMYQPWGMGFGYNPYSMFQDPYWM